MRWAVRVPAALLLMALAVVSLLPHRTTVYVGEPLPGRVAVENGSLVLYEEGTYSSQPVGIQCGSLLVPHRWSKQEGERLIGAGPVVQDGLVKAALVRLPSGQLATLEADQARLDPGVRQAMDGYLAHVRSPSEALRVACVEVTSSRKDAVGDLFGLLCVSLALVALVETGRGLRRRVRRHAGARPE